MTMWPRATLGEGRVPSTGGKDGFLTRRQTHSRPRDCRAAKHVKQSRFAKGGASEGA